MGRGDRRTKKGKIFAGSFGVARPHKTEQYKAPVAAEKKAKK